MDFDPLYYKEKFSCEKCKEEKPTDGALLNRDPRMNYCICRECRDKLVILLKHTELRAVHWFLGREFVETEKEKTQYIDVSYPKFTGFYQK